MEPTFPALAGRFFITEPPGKPNNLGVLLLRKKGGNSGGEIKRYLKI